MAAEIKRSDIIEDGAVKAPLDLAENLGVAIHFMKEFMQVSKAADAALSKATSATKIKKTVDDLTESERQLIGVQTQVSKALAKNNDEYAVQKRGLDTINKVLKQRIDLAGRDAKSINAQNASIKLLGKALDANRDAYSSLATEEARASKAGLELAKIIDRQDKEFKDLKATMGQFQPQVGAYHKFTQSATMVTQTFTPALHGMAQGFMAATKAALAFLATPIGAVLGVLAVVLAPLASFLFSTGDGMDYVEKKSQGAKSALGVLKDEFNDLGKAMFEGNGFWKQAGDLLLFFTSHATNLPVSLDRITLKMIQAGAAGEQFAEAMDKINTAQKFFVVTEEKVGNEVKRLMLQSKNRSKSEEERVALIDKALKKEAGLSEQRIKFAEDELTAVYRLAKARTTLTKAQLAGFKTQEEAANAMAKEFDKADEKLRDQLLDSLKRVEEARGESITIEEKLQTQRDVLLDKADEKQAKRDAARVDRATKLAEALFAIEEGSITRAIAANATNLQRKADLEIDLENLRYKRLRDINEINREKDVKDAGKNKEDIIQINKLYDALQEELEAKHGATITGIIQGYTKDNLALMKAQSEARIEGIRLDLEEEIAAIEQAAITRGQRTAETDEAIRKARQKAGQLLIEDSIAEVEKLLDLAKDDVEMRAALEKELVKLKIDLNHVLYESLSDDQAKQKAKLESDLAQIKAIYSDFANAITSLFNSISERKLQNIDIEEKRETDARDKALAAAGNNATAKAAIEASYQKKLDKFEAERVRQKQKQAKLDKALGLLGVAIQTAQNIVKVYPNPALMALAAALGVLQAAAITAKPIPKYRYGVSSHKGGPAIVGDGGGMERVTIGGKHFLSPATSTLIPDLPEGSSVLPHDQTMQWLASTASRPDMLGRRNDAILVNELRDGFDKVVDAVSETSNTTFAQNGSMLMEIAQHNKTTIKRSKGMIFGKWSKMYND